MKYVLEAFRSSIEFDTFTTFSKLSQAKKAMAEICNSEGRTLAFIRLLGSEGAAIATRYWYAPSAKWEPIDRATYEELIDILDRYRNPMEQAVAA
jgi:hypothetical protein